MRPLEQTVLETEVGCWGQGLEEGMGRECLRGTEFLSGEMKSPRDDGSGGRMTM